jgi:hypothetical protein
MRLKTRGEISMHIDNRRSDRSNELTHAVRRMGESLQRLVELGESLLGVLTVQGSVAGNATLPPTAPRSVGCSAGSENSTGEGVVDLSKEDIISFVQASEMIPTHPSVSTISRWCTLTCRGVKLESTYYGGRRKTTRQAVERFLLACRKQNWAGMHESAAFHLEQAMGTGWLGEQSMSDETLHGNRDQLSAVSPAPTQAKAGRPTKSRTKVSPARTKPSGRATGRRRTP